MLPELAVQTPFEISSGARDASTAAAPRILKDLVRWSVSSFRRMRRLRARGTIGLRVTQGAIVRFDLARASSSGNQPALEGDTRTDAACERRLKNVPGRGDVFRSETE